MTSSFQPAVAASSGADPIAHSGAGARSHRKRIGYLDGWRGIAILLVLIGHFIGGPAGPLGSMGVEVFFVLSGRLMADILFGERFPLPAFFYRRATRIWPVVLLFGTAMILASTYRPDLIDASASQVIASLTFTYNYLDLLLGRGEAVDHMWSLAVEEHCYLVLGLFAFLYRRYNIPVSSVLLMISAAMICNGIVEWFLLQPVEPRLVYWRTDVRGASVIFPAALFLLGWHNRRPAPILLCGLLAIGVASSFGSWWLASSVATVAFGLAVWHIERCLLLRSICEASVLRWFGRASFSIYVWQQPLYKMAVAHAASFSSVHKVSFRLTVALITVSVGAASYYGFENPIRLALNARRSTNKAGARLITGADFDHQESYPATSE